jgi:glycosyltransferase involved in cell wall biosynthesis
MTQKKIKVFTISDHPMSPSGVGLQTRYMIDYLHKTGRYEFVCLGGAVKHQDYRPQRVEEYGEDLIIYPVDGYGTQDIIRQVLEAHKPDILWFMTDPRFYEWLWDIDDEIRSKVPMVYYHVWDNYPYPKFNRKFYLSNDLVCTISKLTDDIVRTVAPEVKCEYIPHSVNMEQFKPNPQRGKQFKLQNFGDKTLFFWNSRNARRKMSGSVIWWFSEFLKEVGQDKAALLMHTDPKDHNGQDLQAIIEELGLVNGEVKFSVGRNNFEEMAMMYNGADATICISDAEGFGLSCLESLACGTPVIANMTGGLQDQVTDGTNFFGVGIYPASKAVIGSQQVPYIYEDRICKEDFIEALRKVHIMLPQEKEELSTRCREHVEKNFNPDTLLKRWDELLTQLHQEGGSWETRKHPRWTLKEITAR